FPGIAGNFFVVLSFVAAIVATWFYYQLSKRQDDAELKKAARWSFRIHAIAVFGIVACLFYILFNHLYEYKYAWDHLSNAMPMQYIFSCFWEGQEGSFLLWTIWHAALGLILLRRSGTWEPHIMAVFSLVQVFLASMLLGVFFGDYQFGSNPFLLMREHPSNFGLPWTLNANYLTEFAAFRDGRGLNPLLQNYWMTIHPPMLFLGFASTIVPFVYAIAGLWKRDYTGWMRPAIPWAFFGVAFLGLGILMGGAWAYEALGFGGFWAWDPVENASLVPWLTLAGAAHLLVLNRRKPTALFTAFLLTIGSFILVLYSTFLTRSGVLGDSSVHSFVDSGILPQLLFYLLVFIALSTVLLPMGRKHLNAYIGISILLFVLSMISLALFDGEVKEGMLPGEGTWIPVYIMIFLVMTAWIMVHSYLKHFPKEEKEEALWSREFWMFIGALVLLVSAVQITLYTSIPVANIFITPFKSLFQSWFAGSESEFLIHLQKANFTAGKESARFAEYHRFQVPLAIIITLLSAVGQFFKYKDTQFSTFLRSIIPALIVSLVLTVILVLAGDFQGVNNAEIALIFSCMFALMANIDYAWRVLKGNIDHMGASVAHIGFALLLLGAVLSMSRQRIVTRNDNFDISSLSKDFKSSEDIALTQNDTLPLAHYFVVYTGKEWQGDRLVCRVDYLDSHPRQYVKDELVQNSGLLFRCAKDHIASQSFLHDWETDSLWYPLPPNEELMEITDPWTFGQPGDYLFTLEPAILQSNKGNSREPSISHSFSHDLYTFLKYADTEKGDTSEYLEPQTHMIPIGEAVELTTEISLAVDSIVKLDSIPPHLPQGIDIKRAYVRLWESDEHGHAHGEGELLLIPMAMMADSTPVPFATESSQWPLKLSLQEKSTGIELTMQMHRSMKRDFIVYHAVVFPQISILWLGCIVMVIGSMMAIRHRIRQSRKQPS
ncbi:MAG: cytochrome c biogenesis protein CcsA, partial [Flavobacteriales bacterium]|nr:cytochrome c biogenesis protein CcsA [Flavobacteriales bacterium]